MENKDIFEIIETIGKQWPFLLVLFIIVVTFAKWKTIWAAITNLSGIKIKKGGTEIELINKPKTQDIQQKINEIELTKTEKKEESAQVEEESLTLFECYIKLKENKLEEAEKLFKQIQIKATPSEVNENDFVFLFYKYINGKATEVEFKEKINKDISPSQKSIGYKYLGLSFKSTNQFAKAVDCLKQALETITDESEKCKIINNISQTYLESKEFDESKAIIINNLNNICEDSNKAELYYQLSKVYEEQKEKILKSVALEKAASLKGNNTSYLFDSAYCYAETDQIEASIYQYLKLIGIDSNSQGGYNNLGVNYNKKDLPLKSIEYYKKAQQLGNSLAAANMAYILIDAGFEEEATKLFKEFIDKPDVHANLISAKSKLLNQKENQQKKSGEIYDSGQNYSRFFNKYGYFYFEHDSLTDLNADDWIDFHGNKVNVKITGTNLEISWELPNPKIGDNDVFSICGILTRSACPITFDFPTTKEPDSWELVYDKNKKPTRVVKKYTGFCYLDLSNAKIEILYKSDTDYNFIVFTRK